MIACISSPADRAAELPGRRIWPLGADHARRAYALAPIVNDSPIALAMVLYNDEDTRTIRWFPDAGAAILWASLDALERGRKVAAR